MRAGTADPTEARVSDAERRLESAAPGFVERVRGHARMLALADLDGTDVGASIVAVEELSHIDLDVPTVSRRPLVRYVKRLVKVAIAWYLGYVARQVTALGHSVAHLGTLMDKRATQIEGRVGGVESAVADLAGRVDRLEARDRDK